MLKQQKPEWEEFVTYLNKMLDLATDPREVENVIKTLEHKCRNNYRFMVYCYLYHRNSYVLHRVFELLEGEVNNIHIVPIPFTYIRYDDEYSYHHFHVKSYRHYKLPYGYFIENTDNILNNIMMLTFGFMATDISINLPVVIYEIVDFCKKANIDIREYMGIIDNTFLEMICRRADSIFDSYESTSNIRNLPIVTREYIISTYENSMRFINNIVINYDDNKAVSELICFKLYKIKELVKTYVSNLDDDYLIRSYFIKSLHRFVYNYISTNLLKDDVISFGVLMNVILLCTKLKVHLIRITDYNYEKGFI